jgi:hypothetical protein
MPSQGAGKWNGRTFGEVPQWSLLMPGLLNLLLKHRRAAGPYVCSWIAGGDLKRRITLSLTGFILTIIKQSVFRVNKW